jgi:hypothetical protein
MKTYIITTLALSLLTGVTLNAQTTTNDEAWQALRLEQGKSYNPNSSEAVAIKEAILAQNQITEREARIVRSVLGGNLEVWRSVVRDNAAKSPFFAALVKTWESDPTGWTPEMVDQGINYAYGVALLPTAPPEFKAQVWARAKTAKGDRRAVSRFFKTYRATLPKEEQIAATAQQKAIMLAIPVRSSEQNAWLAEVSADLIALSLDQQQ